MMTHADIAELSDLYVLDALPADVAEMVEAHLAECVDCRIEVERAWEAARLLRLAVPPVDPSPALRTRIMDIVRTEAGTIAPPLRVAPVKPAPKRGWLPAFNALRLAAAAAVIPVFLVGWLAVQVIALQQQMHATEQELARSWQSAQDATEVMAKAIQRGGDMVRVEGAEMAPAASGMLYYARNENQGVLVVRELPQLPQDQVLQCWLMSGEKRMSGGTFYREEDGRGILVVKSPMALDSVDGIRVTSEPRGGSSEPRGSPYLWARIKGT